MAQLLTFNTSQVLAIYTLSLYFLYLYSDFTRSSIFVLVYILC